MEFMTFYAWLWWAFVVMWAMHLTLESMDELGLLPRTIKLIMKGMGKDE